MSATLAPQSAALALKEERALRAARRWRDAESLLAQAVVMWPEDEALLADHGLLSHEQMRWADMAERFAVLRARFPGNVFGHSRAGEALRWLKRFDDAEAVISAAEPRFAESLELLVQWVLVACDRKDWEAACARAEALMERVPANPRAYVVAANAYARQQRHAEADAALGEGMQRLGAVQPLVIRFAELATERGDQRRAIRRWLAARFNFPDLAAAHLGVAAAFVQAGDAESADRALGDAVRRFPDNPRLAIDYARMAENRFDFALARTRWESARKRFPDESAVLAGLENARSHLSENTAPAAAPAIVDDPATILADPAKLLMQFESVGECCEFGLLQRQFGIEPISLLRWAATDYTLFLKALACDFEGVGDPANTSLGVDGEFVLADRRFGFHMHTFVKPEEVDRDRFLAAQCKRLGFLVRKFREDAASGDKILVRATEKPTTPAMIRALHGALRRYGPVVLLHVTQATDPAQVGVVEWLDHDLMVGHIDHHGRGPGGWNISSETWLTLCRRAFEMRAQGAAPPPVAPPAPVAPRVTAEARPDFRVLPRRPDLEGMLRRVESLGVSCELGLVQRHCAAEPLGLFRFGYTPLNGLVAGLRAGFAGIGDTAQLELTEGPGREWLSTHRTYGFEFHTDHSAATDTAEDVRRRMCVHFKFLARKLLEDLKLAEKLFVFRPREPSPAGEQARELLAAMRAHGNPVLLWVDLTREPARVGTCEWVIPGALMTGYLDRYADVRAAAAASFEAWLKLVAAALALRG